MIWGLFPPNRSLRLLHSVQYISLSNMCVMLAISGTVPAEFTWNWVFCFLFIPRAPFILFGIYAEIEPNEIGFNAIFDTNLRL